VTFRELGSGVDSCHSCRKKSRCFSPIPTIFHFQQRKVSSPSVVLDPQEPPGKTGCSQLVAIVFQSFGEWQESALNLLTLATKGLWGAEFGPFSARLAKPCSPASQASDRLSLCSSVYAFTTTDNRQLPFLFSLLRCPRMAKVAHWRVPRIRSGLFHPRPITCQSANTNNYHHWGHPLSPAEHRTKSWRWNLPQSLQEICREPLSVA
jgi:hypothetical protein